MTVRTVHSRAALDDGIAQLQRDLRTLGSFVDVAIERSLASLQRLDRDLAETVVSDDKVINQLRFAIEDRAVHLIATQQPIAGDLRLVIAVINVIVELERIGDYCVGIARVTLLHGDRPLLKPLVDVPRMAALVREMLRSALDAFIARDAALAERVAARDDEVDGLYDQVYRELLTFMLADPTTIDRATWLLWVTHNLERIGDRVQNICERTIFEVTGVMRELSGKPRA
jgi:phosphate transport system protein